LAISGRRELGETVTDILLERGNREVVHSVAGNSTSSLSPNGHALLVKAAENDDILAEKAGRQLDIPLHLLRELLLKATEAVRARLLALAPPNRKSIVAFPPWRRRSIARSPHARFRRGTTLC
jgi:uncharacterized protein (DUF2336 family)